MAMYKRLAIGESQIAALRSAIEIRCVYLCQFRDMSKEKGYPAVAQKLQDDFSALVHILDDMDENPWERIP
jgi:hypothetical protein